MFALNFTRFFCNAWQKLHALAKLKKEKRLLAGASHAPSSEGKSQQSKPLVAVLAGFELAIARKLPLFLRPVVKASSVPAELRFDARRDLPDLGAG